MINWTSVAATAYFLVAAAILPQLLGRMFTWMFQHAECRRHRHAFATPWAKPMDLIPILLFQLCFLWIYLRSCGGRSIATTAVLTSGYFVVSLMMTLVPPYLNGSILYAPTFLALLCIAAFHYVTEERARPKSRFCE